VPPSVPSAPSGYIGLVVQRIKRYDSIVIRFRSFQITQEPAHRCRLKRNRGSCGASADARSKPPARDVDHLRNCTQSQSNPSWPDRRSVRLRGHCRIQRIEAPVERQQTVRALDHIAALTGPTLIAWSMRSSAASVTSALSQCGCVQQPAANLGY